MHFISALLKLVIVYVNAFFIRVNYYYVFGCEHTLRLQTEVIVNIASLQTEIRYETLNILARNLT